MKYCKNCGTDNSSTAEKCTSCGMTSMLIDKKNTTQQKVRTIYPSCTNCGTTEMGSEDKCKVCNFPKPQQSSSDLSNLKSKSS